MLRKGKSAPPAKKKEPKDLASVLDRELAFEKEDTQSESQLNDIAANMAPFTLEDAPGCVDARVARGSVRGCAVLENDDTPLIGSAV